MAYTKLEVLKLQAPVGDISANDSQFSFALYLGPLPGSWGIPSDLRASISKLLGPCLKLGTASPSPTHVSCFTTAHSFFSFVWGVLMYLSSSGGNLSSYVSFKKITYASSHQGLSLSPRLPGGASHRPLHSLISCHRLSSIFLLSFCIPFSPTPNLCKK